MKADELKTKLQALQSTYILNGFESDLQELEDYCANFFYAWDMVASKKEFKKHEYSNFLYELGAFTFAGKFLEHWKRLELLEAAFKVWPLYLPGSEWHKNTLQELVYYRKCLRILKPMLEESFLSEYWELENRYDDERKKKLLEPFAPYFKRIKFWLDELDLPADERTRFESVKK